MKYCTSCKTLKLETDFYKNSNSCKDCVKRKMQEYYQKNKVVRQAYQKEYYQQHKEYRKIYDKVYVMLIGKKETHKQREYYAKHKQEMQIYDKKRNMDLVRKLGQCVSRSMYNALKQNKAGQHWEDLVTYDFRQLKEHLENQFDEHMNWDNMGSYWEIDHIMPQKMFHFTSPTDKQFKLCWSLKNLRPLEWRANRQRPKDGSDVPEDLKQEILNQEL